MSSRSFLDFLRVQITISFLRLITPTSASYLVFSLIRPQYFNKQLAFYALAEFLFYLLIYRPRRAALQAPSTYSPPQLSQAQRRLIYTRCIESVEHDILDLQYPACWFLPRHSRLYRDDIVDWLLWSFFNTSREQVNIDEHQDELQDYIGIAEKALGIKFENGHSSAGGARCMRVTQDPVDMLHRPLIWYFLVCVADTYTTITLLFLGFKHYAPRDSQWRKTFPPRPLLHFFSRPAPDGAVFPYWVRPHKSDSKLPLLFLHGIGIGWFTYLPFLKAIMKEDPDVGILLPEFMSISMHMTPQSIPSLPLFLAGLDLVLESLRHRDDKHRFWNRVVMISHSYGTFISGWIIRQMVDGLTDSQTTYGCLDKIAHVVLVDPVPFLLSNAALAHNFLYRLPSTVCPHRLGSIIDDHSFEAENPSNNISIPRSVDSFYSSPAAWNFWYFASRDADIARTLFRTFFWTEGALWREDVAAVMTGCPVDDIKKLRMNGSSGQKIRRNVAVVLEGHDQVVPAQGIRKYLTREQKATTHWTGRVCVDKDGLVDIRPLSLEDDTYRVGGKLEVLYHAGLDHSVLFEQHKWMAPLVEVVRRYIRGG